MATGKIDRQQAPRISQTAKTESAAPAAPAAKVEDTKQQVESLFGARSKALEGQRGLMKSVARQWGSTGVTLNWVAVAPATLSPALARAPLATKADAVPVALGRVNTGPVGLPFRLGERRQVLGEPMG